MTRYTIVGAGPVGALMALMLADQGQRVRLIERRPDPRLAVPERGRSINLALAARGMLALEQAGLMQRIAPALIAMRGRMLHETDGALQFLRYGQHEREVIHAVSRERLNLLLIEAAALCPLIELQFDSRCTDVDPQGLSLTWQDERSARPVTEPFEVLLGADGAGSAVRAALETRGYTSSREQELEHDYKELAVASVSGRRARYAFEPHALHIWPRGGYMLIALPNTDASFTATVFLPRHGEPGFDHLHSADAVLNLFDSQFADAARAIPDLAEQFATHPQSRLGTLSCERWQVEGRVLLLGDAAHAIVPFHGQGLNCGFEDCRELAALLRAPAAHEGAARAAAFQRFELERKPNTAAIAAMALENYIEMRELVRSPQFARRQRLAAALERRFPQRFIPRYSMVMFHAEIPYAEAQRRGAAQERVLEALMADAHVHALEDASAAWVEALLDQAGL
jgi:kynurenine 3-monooxygenase